MRSVLLILASIVTLSITSACSPSETDPSGAGGSGGTGGDAATGGTGGDPGTGGTGGDPGTGGTGGEPGTGGTGGEPGTGGTGGEPGTGGTGGDPGTGGTGGDPGAGGTGGDPGAGGTGGDPGTGGTGGDPGTGGTGGDPGAGGTGGDPGAGGTGGDPGTGGTGGDPGTGGTGGDPGTGGTGGDPGTGGTGGDPGTGGTGGEPEVALCGNGRVDPGETCDDGGDVDGDGCSSSCQWEATPLAAPGQSLTFTGTFGADQWDRPNSSCSDTVIQNLFAEHALVNDSPFPQSFRAYVSAPFDDVITLHAYRFPFEPAAPLTRCVLGGPVFENQAKIADFVVLPGELVALVVGSVDSSGGGYDLEVTTKDRCGDAVIGASEVCDVGHTDGGEGCAPDCLSQEPGFTCVMPGIACYADVCGDGYVGGGEECDDGGANSGGCTSACTLVPGWACPIPGSPCRPIECGDGYVDAPETCDDGNTDPNDGCDATCQHEIVQATGYTSIFPGATAPVGRLVQASIPTGTGMIFFSFSATAGTTYSIETFVGDPGACDLPTGVGTGLYLNEGFGNTVATDGFSGVGECSRIVWTAPSSGSLAVWVFGRGSQTLDPLFLLIREQP